ncbi:hypothetical protein [Brucella anthropi]|uniref:hypothetical protein n=1 Tax=Brucella anthropi TaxID=529 RepID=UPI00178C4711|nr:hypothetical protein [Brucella anthropi]
MVTIGEPARITYTNYRGETTERTITPKRIWYGISEWHPEPQWFVTAFDHVKNADRDFAVKDFGHLQSAYARQQALEPDWLHIAKMAGKFGIRYQTNHEFVDFLKAIGAIQPATDHIADAGKLLKGDGGANLERYWRPISEADKSITFEQTYDLGGGKSMTIRNSDHYWVRDANGRVYEATWSDHKDGYWWDLEGESPVDPVEYMPHPLSRLSAPSQEVTGS